MMDEGNISENPLSNVELALLQMWNDRFPIDIGVDDPDIESGDPRYRLGVALSNISNIYKVNERGELPSFTLATEKTIYAPIVKRQYKSQVAGGGHDEQDLHERDLAIYKEWYRYEWRQYVTALVADLRLLAESQRIFYSQTDEEEIKAEKTTIYNYARRAIELHGKIIDLDVALAKNEYCISTPECIEYNLPESTVKKYKNEKSKLTTELSELSRDSAIKYPFVELVSSYLSYNNGWNKYVNKTPWRDSVLKDEACLCEAHNNAVNQLIEDVIKYAEEGVDALSMILGDWDNIDQVPNLIFEFNELLFAPNEELSRNEVMYLLSLKEFSKKNIIIEELNSDTWVLIGIILFTTCIILNVMVSVSALNPLVIQALRIAAFAVESTDMVIATYAFVDDFHKVKQGKMLSRLDAWDKTHEYYPKNKDYPILDGLFLFIGYIALIGPAVRRIWKVRKISAATQAAESLETAVKRATKSADDGAASVKRAGKVYVDIDEANELISAHLFRNKKQVKALNVVRGDLSEGTIWVSDIYGAPFTVENQKTLARVLGNTFNSTSKSDKLADEIFKRLREVVNDNAFKVKLESVAQSSHKRSAFDSLRDTFYDVVHGDDYRDLRTSLQQIGIYFDPEIGRAPFMHLEIPEDRLRTFLKNALLTSRGAPSKIVPEIAFRNGKGYIRIKVNLDHFERLTDAPDAALDFLKNIRFTTPLENQGLLEAYIRSLKNKDWFSRFGKGEWHYSSHVKKELEVFYKLSDETLERLAKGEATIEKVMQGVTD